MQKYSNCTKWTINKAIIYHMNKPSHNELGKEAEQAYWNAFRLFIFYFFIYWSLMSHEVLDESSWK